MHTIIDTKQINLEIIRDLATAKADKKLKVWDWIQIRVFLFGVTPMILMVAYGYCSNNPEQDISIPYPYFFFFMFIMILGVILMLIIDTKREKLIKQFSQTITGNEIAAEYPKYFDKVTKELKEKIAANKFENEELSSKLQGYESVKQDLIPE